MKRLVLKDKNFLLLSDELADKVSQAIQGGVKWLDVGGSLIDVNMIAGIYSDELSKTSEMRTRKMWLCGYNKWHCVGEECRCGFNSNVKPDVQILQVNDMVKKLADKSKI